MFPPLGSGKWLDVIGWIFGACVCIIILAIALIPIRYALHPQQFRDVHYDITRTVYVCAKPAAKTP